MKAILISIKPKWVAKILNGEKTIEIRRTMPKCDLPIEVYIYCTKGKPNLWLPYEYDCFELDEASQPYLSDKPIIDIDHKLNGKVVAKFTLNKVSIIHDFVNGLELTEMTDRHTTIMNEEQLLKSCCLTKEELYKYGGNYAIHISDLEIFDKPKELSEFNVWGIDYPTGMIDPLHDCNVYYKKKLKPLTRAPQNYCYVEVK